MGLAIIILLVGAIIGGLVGVLFLIAASILHKQVQLGAWKSPIVVILCIFGIVFLLGGVFCILNALSALPEIFSMFD